MLTLSDCVPRRVYQCVTRHKAARDHSTPSGGVSRWFPVRVAGYRRRISLRIPFRWGQFCKAMKSDAESRLYSSVCSFEDSRGGVPDGKIGRSVSTLLCHFVHKPCAVVVGVLIDLFLAPSCND